MFFEWRLCFVLRGSSLVLQQEQSVICSNVIKKWVFLICSVVINNAIQQTNLTINIGEQPLKKRSWSVITPWTSTNSLPIHITTAPLASKVWKRFCEFEAPWLAHTPNGVNLIVSFDLGERGFSWNGYAFDFRRCAVRDRGRWEQHVRESERGEESVIFFCQGFNRGIETLTSYFVNQIQVKKYRLRDWIWLG